MVFVSVEDGSCLGWRGGGPNKEYIWLSYSEVEERARAFGAGLAILGIEPGQDSYVGIYCHNMVEVRKRVHVQYIRIGCVYMCACVYGG